MKYTLKAGQPAVIGRQNSCGTWAEISLSGKAGEAASQSLFGTKPGSDCDANGNCKPVSVVTDFTDSADVNMSVLKRAVSQYSDQLAPFLKFVRVR